LSDRLPLSADRISVVTPLLRGYARAPISIDLVLERPPRWQDSRGIQDRGLRGLSAQLQRVAYPRLEWEPPEDASPTDSPTIDTCLDEFVALDCRDLDSIAVFARRWGPLGICNHIQPCTHSNDCLALGFQIGRTGRGRQWEPTAAWSNYVSDAVALLRVAASIRSNTEPNALDVDWLRQNQWSGFTPQQLISRTLIRWMFLAGLTYWFPWSDDDYEAMPTLYLAPARIGDARLAGTSFLLLALQLVAAITHPRDLFICAHCAVPFHLAPGLVGINGRYRWNRRERHTNRHPKTGTFRVAQRDPAIRKFHIHVVARCRSRAWAFGRVLPSSVARDDQFQGADC
jgi:hypothetical protein